MKVKNATRIILVFVAIAGLVSACTSATQSPVTTLFAPSPAQPATLTNSTTPTTTSPIPQTVRATPTRAYPLTRPAGPLFDGNRAYQDVLAQMEFGDRPVGSAALRATGDYFLAQLKASEWQTQTQDFDYQGYSVRNILATKGEGPLIVIGAHYDARARADQDKQNPDRVVPAANDGASGAAVLLELARVLDTSHVPNRVMLAWFDAEDDGNLDMCRPDQSQCDHTPWPWSVGADYVAAHLAQTPQAVIIVDMVGDREQDFYYEQNSDAPLQQQIWAIAAGLGYAQQFIPQPKFSMEDDHTPFLQRGYRAIDVIDFDYPYWHTTQDTADKVSAESLERIGRTLQTWLEE